jgi:hypothetical protein
MRKSCLLVTFLWQTKKSNSPRSAMRAYKPSPRQRRPILMFILLAENALKLTPEKRKTTPDCPR